MRALFFPDYTDVNPYQSNLAEGIEAQGVRVEMGVQFGAFPILRSYLSHDDVEIVHFHWLDPYIIRGGRVRTALRFVTTLFQIVLLRALGVSVLWTCHNVQSHESAFPVVESTFKRIFVRSGLCGRIFVHGQTVVDELIGTYGLPDSVRERIVVVKHGHYIDNYETGSRADARAELGIDESETVFLFFGLIRRYKGVLELVEAFRAAAGLDSRLLIAGDPRTDRLEEDIVEAIGSDDRIVAYLEFIPDDRVHVFMNAADAVVLPFKRMTTSGSAILAMSFGKALVIPRLGIVPELLDDEGAIMYDPDASDGLTTALLTAETRDLSAMGAHNFHRVQEHDWATVAEQTVAVYLDVAE